MFDVFRVCNCVSPVHHRIVCAWCLIIVSDVSDQQLISEYLVAQSLSEGSIKLLKFSSSGTFAVKRGTFNSLFFNNTRDKRCATEQRKIEYQEI